MLELSRTEIERYLKSVIGPSARIVHLKVLGGSEEKDIKSYGYGTPVQIDYECEGKQRRAMLHTISPGPFGHEHMADNYRQPACSCGALHLSLGRHIRTSERVGLT